jgi:PTS system mannose-specific IIA component
MIGLVLATHGDLGRAFIGSMEMIVGEQPQVAALSLQVADCIEDATARLNRAIEATDTGEGVLILTDMLGGTPSNLCLALIGDKHAVEVISGVNLPMVLKAVQVRKGADLRDAAGQVKKNGRNAILVASEVLEGRER